MCNLRKEILVSLNCDGGFTHEIKDEKETCTILGIIAMPTLLKYFSAKYHVVHGI